VTNIQPYLLLAIVVIAAGAVMLAAFHMLRSYRQRRLRAIRGDAADPAFVGDRAYNRIALARREADLLSAQGVDVEQAEQLIVLANHALETRDSTRAYDLAQAAHETLVQARRQPARLRSSTPAPGAAGAAAVPGVPLASPAAAATSSAPAPPPQNPVAKNRAEAQFQLRLFESELAHADKSTPGGTASLEARDLYIQAHAAFARAEYAEAFRLSLRGRRAIGGKVETLGPPAPNAGVPSRAGASTPEATAERLAAQERCAACGYPTVPGDTFCRGCGAAHAPATCPGCGAPRAPTDTFCGSCGQRYA